MARVSTSVLLALIVVSNVGCGGDGNDLGPAPVGGSTNPACDPCFAALVAETDLCGPALDACLDDPTLPVEPIVVCFQTEGACFCTALQRSAQCNVGCDDPAQAQVELCAGQCFLQRADCAEQAVRGTDACLTVCGGSSCEQCTINGTAAFDDCNARLNGCVDRCKATFRD